MVCYFLVFYFKIIITGYVHVILVALGIDW